MRRHGYTFGMMVILNFVEELSRSSASRFCKDLTRGRSEEAKNGSSGSAFDLRAVSRSQLCITQEEAGRAPWTVVTLL